MGFQTATNERPYTSWNCVAQRSGFEFHEEDEAIADTGHERCSGVKRADEDLRRFRHREVPSVSMVMRCGHKIGHRRLTLTAE